MMIADVEGGPPPHLPYSQPHPTSPTHCTLPLPTHPHPASPLPYTTQEQVEQEVGVGNCGCCWRWEVTVIVDLRWEVVGGLLLYIISISARNHAHQRGRVSRRQHGSVNAWHQRAASATAAYTADATLPRCAGAGGINNVAKRRRNQYQNNQWRRQSNIDIE